MAVRFALIGASCALAGALALLGCASILGFEEVTLREGEGDGGREPSSDAAPNADGDASDAAGRRSFVIFTTRGCVAPDGAYTKVPDSLHDPSVYDLLVHTDSGFQGPFLATNVTADAVRFDDLPEGERYVRTTGRFHGYYVVHGDRLDLGSDTLRRADAVPAPPGTTLRIIPDRPDAGDNGAFLQGSLTSYVGFPTGSPPGWNVSFARNADLFDGTRGDLAWVARQKWGTWTQVIEICRLPSDYRMNDAGTSTVSVVCVPPPKERMRIQMRPEAFDESSPPGSISSFDPLIDVVTTPGGGQFDTGLLLESGTVARSHADVELDVANPAPSTWQMFATATIQYDGHVSHADGGLTTAISLVTVRDEVQGGVAALLPALLQPRSVTVGGKNVLLAPASDIGLTPTVILEPNTARATPTRYIVDIHADEQLVAVFRTRYPKLQIPPGMLKSGTEYKIQVNAYHHLHDSDEEPHRYGGVTRTSVSTHTHYFTP